ncbi:RNA-directed DNA polymerase, eukaryota [Tanacetum coccineum]
MSGSMIISIRPTISLEALTHVVWVARTSGGSTCPAGGTGIAGIGYSKNGNLSSTDSTIRRLRYQSMKLGKGAIEDSKEEKSLDEYEDLSDYDEREDEPEYESGEDSKECFDFDELHLAYSGEKSPNPSVGYSGGILCVWDSNMFVKDSMTTSDSFVAIREVSERRIIWDYISIMIDSWEGESVILGDFNEVRSKQERFHTTFNAFGANAFNYFISIAGLVDLPLEGYSYTWSHKSASKMSKLDRFLIYEGLLSVFPSLSAICIDRHLSDHRPILMRELVVDYGPTPFCFFHSWFSKSGFDKLVEETWKNSTLLELAELDKVLDQGNGSDDHVNERSMVFKELQDFNARSSLDMAQKAKIRDWIDEPSIVKNEFLSHFADRFSSPSLHRITLEAQFPKQISFDQKEDLERSVTYDEIKCAIWDCGSNKSHGPDGFTFEFYRRYWKLIDQDVDFRPISLIGSVYKIIAKILANRLSLVIPDLISDVQSAFVANRQILDGPFIINELISWCKFKKTKAMIFKVDFEKPFDSVRWDYLDDILNKFGFGAKWRNWIQGCLNSAMGSILVNGSPTSKSKFHNGLKQGDPLSPFLFILVMESLHLSFNNILNAGLYKGIQINKSLILSHLFYADDAVFIGKWDKSNINAIVSVLNYFFLASGLKINLHKSKLMGINIPQEDVFMAANSIGCTALTAPFNYLDVKVGASSSRSCSWEEVLSKITSRLSKWKLKTLSIDGRLTLLKSVLTSMPLYQMSVYKVPMGVLNRMESMRRNLFNGVDNKDRKISMIGWKKILASEKKGGLGVSSFFALNRVLLFKWIWRFIYNDSSIWYRCIKAIYGVRGALDNPVSNGEHTLFWEDTWLSNSPLKTIFPRLYALECDKHASVAAKFRDSSMEIRRFSAGETSSHLLFSCNVARQLLLKVARWWELDIQDFHSYVDWLSWFNSLRLSKWLKCVLEGVFYVMWWVIWKFRNQVVFGSSHPRLELLFDEIILMSYTWCSSRCKKKSIGSLG